MSENSALSDISSLLKYGKWLMNAPGGATVGTGGLLPGGIAAYQGPGMGAAVATGSSLAAATPFLGLAALAITNILSSALSPSPKIGFSGLTPKYGYSNGAYSGPEKDSAGQGTKDASSKKYGYHITVEDTGKDGEIGQLLVNAFDATFDQLAAQGVPVNDLLKRNSDFFFGGRLDKTTTPETMLQDIMSHMAPDIEAYKAGQTPPPREITVHPGGKRADGLPGKEAYDRGLTAEDYKVTIGPDGASPDKNIALSPNDPRTKLLQQGAPKNDDALATGLTPGFTYSVDTSGMAGRDAYDRGFTDISPYSVPGNTEAPQAGVQDAPGTAQDTATQESTGGSMAGYQYGKDDPKAFNDYINTFYDQATGELGGLDSRQKALLDAAKQEQEGLLGRLTKAVDDTHSSNLPKVDRLAGGQLVSYIPKSLRLANDADRDAEMKLFDRGKSSSDTMLNTGTQHAANYNDALQNMIEMELRRQAMDKDESLARDKLSVNQSQFAAEQEAAKPGFLDYVKGVGTAGAGLKDIGSLLGIGTKADDAKSFSSLLGSGAKSVGSLLGSGWNALKGLFS